MDYEMSATSEPTWSRCRILVNGEEVDALSIICHRDRRRDPWPQDPREKLRKELIPRQLFEVALQAAIGGKIIARENDPALPRTSPPSATAATSPRKRKLLEKQKEGKKKMKQFGKSSRSRRIGLRSPARARIAASPIYSK
jgi:GTP-binding protein LepA